ncbi:MAG: cob(I)yrinic acid a,c-diamide adenosyltransferase [Rikenellaceae bacterium]
MAIYTKTGDKGLTSLIGGERASKTDLRIEAYGTVDELSSFIANLYDSIIEQNLESIFEEQLSEIVYILNRLMDIESLFAADKSMYDSLPNISENDIILLEKSIDKISLEIPKIFKFTLPIGHTLVSKAHICRTVCRRAEREALHCKSTFDISQNAICYLNRLSDYLYSLSRLITFRLEIKETLWQGKSQV